MTEFLPCPAFGIECQYVAEVDRLGAENERLREGVWDIVEDVLADAYDIGKIEAEHHGYLHKRIRAALGETE